jgi:hypothetical protein
MIDIHEDIITVNFKATHYMGIPRRCLRTIPSYFYQVYHVYSPFYNATTKSTISWDVTPFSLVQTDRHCCHLHAPGGGPVCCFAVALEEIRFCETLYMLIPLETVMVTASA